MSVLVATDSDILLLDPATAVVRVANGLADHRPTDVAWDPWTEGRAWAGTRAGVVRSDDAGASWRPAGLEGEHVMTMAPSPVEAGVVWAGTEPSALYRSEDGGASWRRVPDLDALPSSSEWAFPPRPETHHVRWIAPHPRVAGRLWVAIEAGALVRLEDGAEWHDRVPGGPYDTHELAVHPDRPDTLRVAAGDGYYESEDAGRTWTSPRDGFDVGYLRSVVVDPGDPHVVLVSAASGPRSAYMAGRSDGRVYRRQGHGAWRAVSAGWPDQPRTIAPLLRAGAAPGEMWAVDERGVHRSDDGGRSWQRVAAHPRPVDNLRGLAVMA